MSEFVRYFVESSRTRWGDPHGAGPVAFVGNAVLVAVVGLVITIALWRRTSVRRRVLWLGGCLAASLGLAACGAVRLWFDLANTVAGIAEFELEQGGQLLVLGGRVPAAIPERSVGLVHRQSMSRAEALEWLGHPNRLLVARTATLKPLQLVNRTGVVWSGAGIDVVAADAPWYWRRPMLTWASATEAELLWETPDEELGAVRVRTGRRRWVVTEDRPRRVHRVRLTELEPATVHSYTLKSNAVPGENEGAFRTLPAAGEATPLRFAVLGDSGGGHPVTRKLVRRLAEFQPDVILHVGDLAYDRATRASLYAQYYGVMNELGADVPIWVVPGNHDLLDGGGDLAGFFGLDVGSDEAVHYQRVLHAGSVTIAGINSNAPPLPLGRTRRELARQIDAGQPGLWWRITFFHHPPFPGEGRGRNDLVYWLLQPLLVASHVDLAFAGHSHNYQRSLPLGLAEPRADGVRYVVSGGGGGELREPDESTETTVRATAHNVVRAIALEGRLWLEAIDESGRLIDRVVLAKDAPGAVVREEAWSDPPPDTRRPLRRRDLAAGEAS